MKPAIVLYDLATVSETFIKRHISYLNQGSTTIITTSSSLNNNCPDTFCLTRSLMQRLTYKLFSGSILDMAWLKSMLSQVFFEKLLSYASANNVDYLLFEFGTLAVDNYDVALHSGLPYVIYFRGYDASMMLRNQYYVRMLSKLVKEASCIFTVSSHLVTNLESAGIVNSKTYVIPSSVEYASYIPYESKDINLFLSVGRLVEKKHHSDTLKAFSIFLIKSKSAKARLKIIGGGPLYSELLALVKILGIEARVKFTGASSNDDVLSCMTQAAYYVQSSANTSDGDMEGFPSSIQEAMMRSCVILSTRHGGVNLFLENGKDSLLCAEDSPSQMASNMLKAYYNSGLAKCLARTAHSKATEDFNIEVNAHVIDRLILNSIKS